MKLTETNFYQKVVRDPWPYVTGAVLLAILNIALFTATGNPWGVTTPFSYWGAWIWKAIGGHPESWGYFAEGTAHGKALMQQTFLTNGGSIMNLGIVIGALFATLAASQFKIKKIKNIRQVIAAVLGGLAMGYGARIAFGCNVGAFFSGVASFSLHGWIYTIFIFAGAWIGSKLLVKYLM